MKRKISGIIAAAVAVSSFSFITPLCISGETEEYLVRDKWGYCKTANYAESEHFVIFYGNNDTTGQVNEAFLKRNLDDYEKLWRCYGEYLGMKDMNVDIYGKSQQKYKTNVYLTNTGLDKYPEGWAFMSSEDGYGIEIISPEAMLDDLTIAHEFGHVVTMQQKAWVDQEITGAWWESLANWFREMYIGSEYYTGDVQTVWFEPYLRNLSLCMPHGRDYYEVWPFLVYLSDNPDNLPGLGTKAVSRIISEAKPDEMPLDTITRLFGTDIQTVFGHYAKRMATFDFGNREAYQKEFSKKLGEQPYFWNLVYTVPEETSVPGVFHVPEEEAPMQGGINIIPLYIAGDDDITVEFSGLSDDDNASWKACVVTVDMNGNESYSDLFGSGESVRVPAKDAVSAYITVSAMPEKINRVNAFHKEADTSYRTGDEKRRYPYEVKISGAGIHESGSYIHSVGHKHTNGGGWISGSARVSDSVYVGPDAMVGGNAVITDNVRIEDHAVVSGDVNISGNAVISGHAFVSGGGWVYGENGWKQGSVKIDGNVIVSDSAVVSNSCTLTGNARVLQKAFVTDAVTLKDYASAKGMAYLYGQGSYSGTAVLDGDYANEEKLNSGISFGWLDNPGKAYSEPLNAEYSFDSETKLWSSDRYSATDAFVSGAQWQSERTSAKGVMNFDGKDDCIVIDSSAVRTHSLQISTAVLWKGGSGVQELFKFGGMTFTPSGDNGKAQFKITDGKQTTLLTAPSALEKDVWNKITVRISDGRASLLINGKTVSEEKTGLTPVDAFSGTEGEICTLGKGSDSADGFRGAVDYISFYYDSCDEPSVSYSGKEEPENDIIKGDINSDGTVNTADFIVFSEYLLGMNTNADREAADISEDGKVNIADLVLLKAMLAS